MGLLNFIAKGSCFDRIKYRIPIGNTSGYWVLIDDELIGTVFIDAGPTIKVHLQNGTKLIYKRKDWEENIYKDLSVEEFIKMACSIVL